MIYGVKKFGSVAICIALVFFCEMDLVNFLNGGYTDVKRLAFRAADKSHLMEASWGDGSVEICWIKKIMMSLLFAIASIF